MACFHMEADLIRAVDLHGLIVSVTEVKHIGDVIRGSYQRTVFITDKQINGDVHVLCDCVHYS